MAILSNQPIPDNIANPPKVKQGQDLFIICYYALDNDRNISLDGIGYIKYSSILEYSKFHNFDYETTVDLIYVIQSIDRNFVSHIRSKKPNG